MARNTFWTELFDRYFLDAPPDDSKDDMLFYIKKSTAKSKFQIPQTEVEVHRKSAKNLPLISNPQIDWEETVYLNLILQQVHR